ncbi:unnamed protein product [Mesocestoides corti]|uniref:DUF5737 domain-containing protein n=1 Tax=Mesocestoides corti TaxID=53468 RepID=A0A0R3UBV8_MESCO|nr:unnamed protein product [Mesocestoides corti]
MDLAHESPKRLHKPPLSGPFREAAFDYGFIQADLNSNTCYYLVYQALKEALDRRAPRCWVKINRHEVHITNQNQPFEEVTIFTDDIVSYYKFDYGFKFVALCIDANKREKTGYWFINFDNRQQLVDFCIYLTWIFSQDAGYETSEKGSVSYCGRKLVHGRANPIPLIKCWCCGSIVIASKPDAASSNDSGFEENQLVKPGVLVSTPPPSLPTRFEHPRYFSHTKRHFRRW